jgi:hypothetical protein
MSSATVVDEAEWAKQNPDGTFRKWRAVIHRLRRPVASCARIYLQFGS